MHRARTVVVAVAVVAALFLGLAYGTFAWANSRSFMVAGDLVQRVDTSGRVVALTFDDGPTTVGLTEIRQALKSEGVTATFFLVGADVAAHPADIKNSEVHGEDINANAVSGAKIKDRTITNADLAKNKVYSAQVTSAGARVRGDATDSRRIATGQYGVTFPLGVLVDTCTAQVQVGSFDGADAVDTRISIAYVYLGASRREVGVKLAVPGTSGETGLNSSFMLTLVCP